MASFPQDPVTSTQRRKRIDHILRGKELSDSPFISGSALKSIADEKIPQLILKSKSFDFIWNCVAVAWFATVIGLFHLVFTQAITTSLLWYSAAAVACGIILLGTKARSRRLLKGFVDGLKAPVEELQEYSRFLNDYHREMTSKTADYFHCVTSSKVTANFALMQLRSALETRITEIQEKISNPTAPNLVEAYKKLQGSILFSDGAMPNTGETRIIPLANLQQTITLLTEELDRGIAELEDEIGIIEQV